MPNPFGNRGSNLPLIAAAAFVGLFLTITGIGNGVDRDLQLWRNSVRARPATGRLALVEIDARSMEAITHWPWPRRLHAQAIDALNRAGAQTIAFDVDFAAHADRKDDALLARAIMASRAPVILPTFRQPKSDSGGGIVESLPLAIFARVAQLASVNIELDPDGLVRRYPYGTVTAGVPRPSMGALLAASAGTVNESFAIDGAIDPASIPRISFIDLVRGRVPEGALQGRSVLIGATAIELGDRYSAPGGRAPPGSLIQLLAAETLLQGTSPLDHGAIPLLLLALTAMPFLLQRTPRQQFAGLSLALLILIAAPLALEAAKQGTLDIIPAAGMLIFAVGTSAVLAAAHEARTARLVDADTGLPNRRSLQYAPKCAAPCALIAVRVGSYSRVAGVLGQSRGAELILRVAERLALASDGPVYRIEESALAWWAAMPEVEEQISHVDSVSASLRMPVEVAGRQVELGCAFGLADTSDSSGDDPAAHALLAADRALSRGERWNWYSAEIDRESDWRLSLPGELDRAIVAGDIWVAYQPKYDIKLCRVTGAEALVRWRHPERGPILPDAFIPILERNGRILDLTLHVLRQAVRDAVSWTAQRMDVNIAVNVSALLPADPDFIAGLREAIAVAGFAAEMLTLEVTESATMSNPEAAIPALEALAAMGIRLSIDDYGTGQSTLSYLKRLPGNEIKIDKSFVLPLETSRGDQAMVRSTIELAHELGYKVVAEGVEDEKVLELLRGYGCDYAQGWHIGKAVSAKEFEDLFLPNKAALHDDGVTRSKRVLPKFAVN